MRSIKIRINEDIISPNIPMIKKEFNKVISEKKSKALELDFQNVSTIDSVGIGVLLYMRNELSKYGKKLIIINASQYIANFINITNMNQIIDIM